MAVEHPAESCPDLLKHFRLMWAPANDWDDAKSSCESSEWMGRQGGFATVRSAEQQALIERMGFVGDVMLGGAADVAGVWRWVGNNEAFWNDGAVSSYHHFYRTTGIEMPRAGGRYLYILRGTHNDDTHDSADMYRWGDDEKAAPYVCEYCLAEAQMPSIGGVTQLPNVEGPLHCDRRGRVLIQQGTKHSGIRYQCGNTLFWQTEVTELPLDGCGYLSESSVRQIARRATQVTLYHYAFEEFSSATDEPVEALRTGGQWFGTEQSNWYELNQSQWHPNDIWCWDINQYPAHMGNGHRWPFMYHATGTGCAHIWNGLNGLRYIDSYNDAAWYYHFAVWLTMEEGVCPCQVGQKQDELLSRCEPCAVPNATAYQVVAAASPTSCGVLSCEVGTQPDMDQVRCEPCGVPNALTYFAAADSSPPSCGVMTCVEGFTPDQTGTRCDEVATTPEPTHRERDLPTDDTVTPLTPNPLVPSQPLTYIEEIIEVHTESPSPKVAWQFPVIAVTLCVFAISTAAVVAYCKARKDRRAESERRSRRRRAKRLATAADPNTSHREPSQNQTDTITAVTARPVSGTISSSHNNSSVSSSRSLTGLAMPMLPSESPPPSREHLNLDSSSALGVQQEMDRHLELDEQDFEISL